MFMVLSESLEAQFQGLKAYESDKKVQSTKDHNQNKLIESCHRAVQSLECVVCNANRKIYSCGKFSKWSPEQ